ncbi:uncharacterized protein LOC126249465 [Schistocerca nitens]|uniref:uncharacterized protein LOC126249465 n=1 Tax=Schistocerca nitens TaxID=7011 RepID=UPI00211827ED|nr:uncharacterized protein LOC126249465 [Schistocerca nitens]
MARRPLPKTRKGARARKKKPRVIPEQDRRICGSICLCQLTVVASCVAIVYLTVVVYLPSHRVFKSSINPVPVMCHTAETIMMKTNCPWASCGEWCLTRTTGFCPQIHVMVRRNGTEILFQDCMNIHNVDCPQVNPSSLPKFNCNNGSECGALTGFYSCKNGHCDGMSKMHECTYKADGLVVDSERENVKLNGYFLCKKARCTKWASEVGGDRLHHNIFAPDLAPSEGC